MTIRRIVVVSPAGPGSKGDEALIGGTVGIFEAYPIIVLNPDREASWLDVVQAHPSSTRDLREVSGPIRAFADQLREDDVLFVVGADVIDGSCGLEPAMDRIDLMADALAMGLPVYASCSFRSGVAPELLEQYQHLVGVRFLVRDELSLENLKRQTGISGQSFPDLSFFLPATEQSIIAEALSARLAEERSVRGPIIGLNFSEQSFRSFSDEHSEGSRRAFIATVLNSLIEAHPSAFFVLLSNDCRDWPNHPSDDDFGVMALDWIASNLGPDRAANIDRSARYIDNIKIVELLDFLVTGRMHLACAAFRVRILPLVLMGEGRSYSSVDKMRGAFERHLGTAEAVVDTPNEIGRKSAELMDRRADFAEILSRQSQELEVECEMCAKQLHAEISSPSPSVDPQQAAIAFARLAATRKELLQLRGDKEKADADRSTGSPERICVEKEEANHSAALEEILAKAQQARIDDARRIASLESELAEVRGKALTPAANFQALIAGGDALAEKLRRAYDQPLKPLIRATERSALRLALLLGSAFSERRRKRFRRSLAKRVPTVYREQWDHIVSEAMVGHDDVLFAMNRDAGRRATRTQKFAHRALLLLADLFEPISERRSRRFRRSAEKRAPRTAKLADETIKNAEPQILRRTLAVDDLSRSSRILVADFRLPRPDFSAGERATFGLLTDLVALGYDVVFIAFNGVDDPEYRKPLEDLGITVITGENGADTAASYIRAQGREFGVFYLIRFDVAETLIHIARAMAPNACILYHAPDLCFLRESRAAKLSGNADDFERAARSKVRESAMMRASDHIVLVSPAERPFVEKIVPRDRISIFPALYSSIVSSPPGFAFRKNLFFLGGFEHKPNHGAVRWFVDGVWPLVRAAIPEAEFHILGAEAPPDIRALGQHPGVRFIGYVSDLDAALSGYRISVAPLLFGAGIKGKVASAMGAGVPTVTTRIGAEGMGIADGVHALVRDEATAFAEAVCALYLDEELWNRLSSSGQKLVARRFGGEANRAALLRVLEAAGALPFEKYISYCKAAAPVSLPTPESGGQIDLTIVVALHGDPSLSRACLKSLALNCLGTGLQCEVICTLNEPSDEMHETAEFLTGFKIVQCAANKDPLACCNDAVAEARGRCLLFVDNTTIVSPNWLEAIVEAIEREPNAAMVGSKILRRDGQIDMAGGVLFSDATVARVGHGQPQNSAAYAVNREVDVASWEAMLVRRSFWDTVGGFDNRFASFKWSALDLMMSAREQNMKVMYAAEAVAVKTNLVIDGTPTPGADQAAFLAKWKLPLETEHLPRGTPLHIAVACAERTAPTSAAERRRAGRLNILYFSPFPSHPDSHGNQATIQSFGRRFQKMGHRVHFALLESTIYDSDALDAMRTTWDTFDILPNSRRLWADGSDISFDSWYDPRLGENVRRLCEKYEIDVLFCSYVFQSKLLEYVPAHVLKVIDTHDKMGNRYEMLRANGQPVEFFSCTPEEEGAYLRRADLVAARRAEEARYFDEVMGSERSFVLPHVEDARNLHRTFHALRKVGVVASANRINLIVLHDFLAEIARRCGDNCPFTVEIAGQVKSKIGDLSPEQQREFRRPWVRMLGFVPDISTFYNAVDLIVSPVTMGTGINVKTVQAMAFGMPLITTKVGIKGIETDEAMHNHETLVELVDSLFNLLGKEGDLSRLAAVSVKRYCTFLESAHEAIQHMFKHPKIAARSCFCGAPMKPLVQFGHTSRRNWRGQRFTALTCSTCCYVTFDAPSERDLAQYYKEEYGKGSQQYYTIEDDYDAHKTSSRADIALNLSQTFLPKHTDPVFLELGCAFGGTVFELRRRGFNAFGMDLNSTAITAGKKRGNQFLSDSPPEQFPSESGTQANVITSFHMLEHVPDVRRYLTALKPVLCEGGVAMFRVPNGSYLKPWLKGFETWDWFAFPDHLHMLTRRSVSCLVRSCGYELVSLRSNACGESVDSVRSWLPEGHLCTEASMGALGAAGCLMELEFVIRKPGSSPTNVVQEWMAEASADADRSADTERALKHDPEAFAAALLRET
ncbi:MAG: glycosyltransferase [Hyphomicrobiaceae bacterium]